MDNLNILFIGDSGSGKSSILNSIIKEYYNGIDDPNDILYINNLKEQGIQYYRNEVKTFCQTPIKQNANHNKKKKFVVLDDIDTINEQSQQVFRNYIDKYSHNINFIISCANLQKVIESLQSRTIIIKLKLLCNSSLKKILHKIKRIEHINISPEAEDFIIDLSNKSVKMMINYIEKFKLMDCNIDLEIANSLCTNISFYKYLEYNQYCLTGDINKGVSLLYDLYDNGYSVMDIFDNYFLFIKMGCFF
jgi:DNA polymerase III delta prime subunit